MRIPLFPGLALLGVLGVAPVALAQPASDIDSAEALFKSAKAAMDHGDLATACPRFAESQRLDPAAGTLLNLGECEARDGRIATALGHFQEGRAALPAGDYRIVFAEEKIASLLKRVPRLAVRIVGELPAGARVGRDGIDLPTSSLGVAVPVDPGEHVVTLSAPGRVTTRTEVRLEEGRVETAELGAGPAEASPEPAASSGSPQRTAGIVMLGIGAAGLGIGAVLGLVAKGTYDSASSTGNCPSGPSSCNAQGVSGGQSAHAEAAASTAAFIVGGVLGAAGATLFFTAPRERQVALSPVFSPQSAGLALAGAW
jgi:hypothetical protein